MLRRSVSECGTNLRPPPITFPSTLLKSNARNETIVITTETATGIIDRISFLATTRIIATTIHAINKYHITGILIFM